jgi:hypothetical protein
VTAVIGLALYGPVLHDTHYVLRASGGDGRVLAGAICEIFLAISVLGTAVTLYPVVRREHEGLAIGSCGVEDVLARQVDPACSSTSSTPVKVPPASTPRR